MTKISNAVVRTTHLTGLVTDLGIEISQLIYKISEVDNATLVSNIKLRIYIIIFFFAGGLIGGFTFAKLSWGLNTLLLAVMVLLIGLFYDGFKNIIRQRKYATLLKK